MATPLRTIIVWVDSYSYFSLCWHSPTRSCITVQACPSIFNRSRLTIPTQRRNKMLKYLVITAGFVCTILLSACNTMEGMGEDIQEGGQSLENEAQEHND